MKHLALFLMLFSSIPPLISGSVHCFTNECQSRGKYGCNRVMKEKFETDVDCCNIGGIGISTTPKIKPLEGSTRCFECYDCYEVWNKVDGEWSEWSEWEQCSQDCGTGIQERTRRCNDPPPSKLRKDCEGRATQSRSCNTHVCPVDGEWGAWTDWELCSRTCGNGMKSRHRECDSPPPFAGGKQCKGEAAEIKTCNTDPCPVDGQWSQWTDWNLCSVTCGKGTQTRKRTCNNPVPKYGGKMCIGNDVDTKQCTDQPICSVDGGWSGWSSWGLCSRTCGNGMQTRTRQCDSPEPLGGGKYCPGDPSETKLCNIVNCPVDGDWSQWSLWGICSVTCGDGIAVRHRKCDNPVPMFNGNNCVGLSKDAKTCSIKRFCPIDGEWSSWTDWGSCSMTCGEGTRSRKRNCNDPKPMYDGKSCIGNDTETKSCSNLNICSVDGGWSDWSDWKICSRLCGGGIQTRTRECNNPNPTGAGKNCEGDHVQYQICNTQHCPIDGDWSPWSLWNSCSATCGKGVQIRERRCNNPTPMFNGKICSGTNNESRNCSAAEICPGDSLKIDGKWTSWTVWSFCSATCGAGTHMRSRYCNNPAPLNGGKNCIGNNEETKSCTEIKQCLGPGSGPGNPDNNWTDWSDCIFDTSSGPKGQGIMVRFLKDCQTKGVSGLTHNKPTLKWKSCFTENTQSINGGWSEWSFWDCSTCKDATRTRTCTQPAPKFGGATCTGSADETISAADAKFSTICSTHCEKDETYEY